MSEPAAVLAIDGGNSKTDVALVGCDGTILSAVRGGPSNHQGIGVEAASSELLALVRKAAELAGLPGLRGSRRAYLRLPGRR